MSVAVAPAPVPANGHANGDASMADASAPRFASGLILPPPEIKTVIDRTALFVARSANPPQFEQKIRQNQVNDPKFSFLNPTDPYHAYYRHRMARIEAGEEDDTAQSGASQGKEGEDEPASAVPQQTRGREPPAPEFMLDAPNISSMELDTIRLTALFTARRGRTFLATLSAREGRNYQFEFLRPTHTLFGYFNRLVEQYTKVLLPPKETLDRLSKLATPDGKWKILEETREYAEWERIRREREKKRQDDKEAERKAFAEIDWHDYVVVQTIEFTAADATSDLPVPMTIQEMESMTVAQKRITNMITETAAEDIDAYNARRNSEAAAPPAAPEADDVQMEEGGDEAEEIRLRKRKEDEERARELERAKQIQATSLDASGSIKIRTDYVPKLNRKDKGPAYTTCQICGQQVPTDEIHEHMRIELLDPRWKEQRDMLEARKAQAAELQKGADVSATVKALARARVDIFGDEQDEVARQQEKAQQEAQAKEREKNVWDGHTASKLTTLEKYQTNVNFDEQIAAIHRAKGLTAEGSNIGPGIGPASVPLPVLTTLPPPPPSLPANPNLGGGAPAPMPMPGAPPISAIPVPPPAFGQPPPMMLPPLHYPPVPMMGGPPVPGAPPGMHPSRLAALAGGPPPQLAGQVRSADEMMGGDLPPAKRQRVAKLPEGQYYPEADWVNMHPHPISLRIQLPSYPEKPEWKMDGSVATVPDLPVTLLLSTLRDRIIQQLGSTVAASKMRISYGGKMLTNANSIASYNLEDEDLLALTVKDEKKKR